MDAFGDKVHDVVVQAFALQKAIGEGVLSAEYQVIRPLGQSTFSSDLMADVDDCGRGKGKTKSSGKLVLCTTGIGLSKVRRVEDDGETSTSRIVSQTIVKADVLLVG